MPGILSPLRSTAKGGYAAKAIIELFLDAETVEELEVCGFAVSDMVFGPNADLPPLISEAGIRLLRELVTGCLHTIRVFNSMAEYNQAKAEAARILRAHGQPVGSLDDTAADGMSVQREFIREFDEPDVAGIEGIFRVDTEGIVHGIDDDLAQALGYTREELLGKPAGTIIQKVELHEAADDLHRENARMLVECLSGQNAGYSTLGRLRNKRGQTVYCEMPDAPVVLLLRIVWWGYSPRG